MTTSPQPAQTLEVVAAAPGVTQSWGQAPLIGLIGAFGLLLIALANAVSRAGNAAADPLFWAGMLCLFVPVALRLAAEATPRRERLALVAGLGLGLYAVKLAAAPLHFTFFDEFSHWRATDDLLATHHLFGANPLHDVSAFFPGLHLVTAALSGLGQLPIFLGGITVVALARLLLCLSLFLFFERVGGSARVAGLASLIYFSNPSFVFFGAAFSYETLALALAAFVLWQVVGAERAALLRRTGVGAPALLGILALVATHHLSAYALSAFLLIWAVFSGRVALRGPFERTVPAVAAGVSLLACAVWLLLVARTTLSRYLLPQVEAAAAELRQFLSGEGAGRQLFQSSVGQSAPLLEQLLGYAAVLVILLALPLALRAVWQRLPYSAAARTLAVLTLMYPLSLALRFTRAGAEISGRTSEFVFVALALVLAVWLADRASPPRPRRIWATGAYLSTLFVGGVIVGWAPTSRLAGAYLVGADARSVEPRSVYVARWARANLQPGQRVLTDRTNRQLWGSYGRQNPQRAGSPPADVNPAQGLPALTSIFFSERWGFKERAVVGGWGLRYLVVDKRLSAQVPLVGLYFETSEPGARRHTLPISAVALNKFSAAPDLSRIYDDGEIGVYDAGKVNP